MCGTFAILSPDLFTYVYSRIPPGREREFIQKDEGGWGGEMYRRRVWVGENGSGWQGCKGGGREARMEDGVSHELEKQPKAVFAPFLKFFTTFFDAPPPDCSAGKRSRKRQRERAISPSPLSSPFLPLSFFTESRNVHTGSVYLYPVDVCQTVSVFISRLIASLHVRWFLPRLFWLLQNANRNDLIKCAVLRSCFINTKCLQRASHL